MRKRKNISADSGHFLRTEIHSTDFENENLTKKTRRNKAKKKLFF